MIAIREEIRDDRGRASATARTTRSSTRRTPRRRSLADDWTHPYSREQAAFPLPWVARRQVLAARSARIDNAYGDRNLVCTCPPVEEYATR